MSRGYSAWWLQDRGDNRQFISKRTVVRQMIAAADPNSADWKAKSQAASLELGDRMEAKLPTKQEWDAAWEAFWATVPDDATCKQIVELCTAESLKWK